MYTTLTHSHTHGGIQVLFSILGLVFADNVYAVSASVAMGIACCQRGVQIILVNSSPLPQTWFPDVPETDRKKRALGLWESAWCVRYAYLCLHIFFAFVLPLHLVHLYIVEV